MTNWIIQGKVKKNANRQRISEIENVLLNNRGIKTKKSKELFFNPPHPLSFSLKSLGFDVKFVRKAVQRILKSIKDKEKIVVFGDYDADGINGTAILWETLYSLTNQAMPYLPHRVNEGYGLSQKGIENVIKQYNPKLLITVDNGVTAKDAVEFAKNKGIDVIITDHHIIPKAKPKPFSLVHTIKLSGSGVAWYLAREILEANKKDNENLEEKLGLCAMGTIADILPLEGVNRSIVSYGISKLRKPQRPGLKALYRESGILAEEIDTYHIGYIIAPRINASGRISHSMDSLRLLCTKSSAQASIFALNLGQTNLDRKKITQDMVIHADNVYQKSRGKNSKLIYVYHESYNQGVIGLVAGKLVEKYYRPSIVLSVGEEISKASARSINGFNIIENIRKTSHLLIDCGGHPMAAGFTIKTVNLEKFRKEFEKLVNLGISDKILKKSVFVDCELDLSDVNSQLFESIEKFKPFGAKNSEPKFASFKLKPVVVKLIGKDGNHLKLEMENAKGERRTGVAFGAGNFYSQINKDSLIDCVYTLSQNKWNNHTSIEMKIRDIKIN
ncbi:single-stranded-DNA-specific exonuclease RecJ [Candidatus Gottesmanbacteria bacterium]|nr:single-stranded-DNA-specific exonuclease RecJ [Candidatus Gottesmanbacteria bacterium]